MNFYIIEKCLEDYLQALFRNGTEEEQEECIEAIHELQKLKANMKE